MVGCWLSPSSCFVDPQLFTMSACGRESELALVSSSPYKGTDPILGAPTSLTSPKPNYLPKPHLQLPSNWGLGIQHTDVEEEHKHSVHSIHLLEQIASPGWTGDSGSLPAEAHMCCTVPGTL